MRGRGGWELNTSSVASTADVIAASVIYILFDFKALSSLYIYLYNIIPLYKILLETDTMYLL